MRSARRAGSLLFAHGKTLKQVQGWLRRSRLSTTMDVYIQQVDDGLGAADVWDDIMPGWGNSGATVGQHNSPMRLQTVPQRRRRKPCSRAKNRQ